MSLTQEQRARHWSGVKNPFWWIFCGPGAIFMEVQYWVPAKGNIWLSRRQYGNRSLQFLYTLLFYIFIGFVVIPGR